ncbi:MAG: acetate--CoA ligase family protein [Desulfococcaceae bacterium]|jgi:acyl-CoA synthetase (NDP forming)|nr:acetate--CoA ligase family protein [Desulfococcaceae bacterium]
MEFTAEVRQALDAILASAYKEGREMLYEHEIYRILRIIGLRTPEFAFIREAERIDEDILRAFGHHLILKIVSPDIAHKQKLGGVKKVRNYDPLYIQFVLHRMKEEVLSCFPPEEQPEISGFLLTEFIPHTQALGYEVLLGFKEDSAFGPVMTLSKGGDDAEFFARYYDPPCLFLPPLDAGQSRDMVNSLNIRHKFEERGQTQWLDAYAQAVLALSRLAFSYSFIADPLPEFILRSLDINPFVISEDKGFTAVDGYAVFARAADGKQGIPSLNLQNLKGFFRPEGVAVVGVSSDPEKHSLARLIVRQLLDMGRKDIFLINPKGGSIRIPENGEKFPFYPSLAALPQRTDLLVYSAPAVYAHDFFQTMPEDCPKSVILIPGIPPDTDYKDFAAKLKGFLPEDVRVVGPNCMGVFYAPEEREQGVNTLFIEEERLDVRYSEFSNTVLLTQSGAYAVTAIDKFQNSRLLKSVVSFGNKFDVKITELMAWFTKVPGVDVIAIYAEGLDPGEGRQFFELAKTIRKPLIVYKAGKTDAGAKMMLSHTASMSGSYEVFRAACEQSGVILAETIEDHYGYMKAFSLLSQKIPRGNRVAGVVNAGFESAVGADELLFLQQTELSGPAKEQFRQKDSTGLIDTGSSFLDVTPMADDRLYADYIEILLKDEQTDCIFVSVVPHTNTLKTDPETCHDPDSLAMRLSEMNRRYDKPLVVSVNAGRYYQEFVSVMEKSGLPVYTDIRPAVRSLDRFASWHLKGRKSV